MSQIPASRARPRSARSQVEPAPLLWLQLSRTNYLALRCGETAMRGRLARDSREKVVLFLAIAKDWTSLRCGCNVKHS
jgi:hypothetical protein